MSRLVTEALVSEIWEEVLDQTPVDRAATFVDAGGCSRDAMAVVARLWERAGALVTPADVLWSSVAELSSRLEGAGPPPPSMPPLVAPGERVVASLSQQRLWFLERSEKWAPALNLCLVYDIDGPLDAEALGRAWTELERRHLPLRSTFAEGDAGDVYLEACEPGRATPTAETREASELPGLISDIAHRRFDLRAGPLTHAALYRTDERTHIFVVAVHQSACDVWSLGMLDRDLRALYQQEVGGPSPALPTLSASYLDYAEWQRTSMAAARLESQRRYWRETLLPPPEPTVLPSDRPRPRERSWRGRSARRELPPHLVSAVVELARNERATPYVVWLTAFLVTLRRHVGQEQVTVGVPLPSRPHSAFELLVGAFANTVVLSVRLPQTASFRDAIRATREVHMDALAHPDVPFEEIVRMANPERDPSTTPLFQAYFEVIDLSRVGGATAGAHFSARLHSDETALTDLGLVVHVGSDSVRLELTCAADLFDAETGERLLTQYLRILSHGVGQPDTPFEDLPWLSDEERAHLEAWIHGEDCQGPDECIHHLVERRVALHPDRIAVRAGIESLTYGELDERANRVAAQLQALGVGPERAVGILANRTVWMAVALLGVLKAGGAYVPLDPEYPRARLAHILSDAGVEVVVLDRELEPRLPESGTKHVYLAEWDPGSASPTPKPSAATPSSLAYVIYTSGSSGPPKGVLVEHRSAVGILRSVAEAPGMEEEDIVLALASLSFDVALLDFFGPLSIGAQCVVGPTEIVSQPNLLSDLIERSGATWLQGTPSFWRILWSSGWQGAKKMKGLVGGEALAPDLAEGLGHQLKELWNVYGPTETTVDATRSRVRPGQPIRIGKPHRGYSCYVLDHRRRLVPVGVIGELYVGGQGVARGYSKSPELTERKFLADPFRGGRMYRTGDLCRYAADGELEFISRSDKQVKLRGFRVELGEIESSLGAHDGVRIAVATVIELRPGDQRLVAYYVPSGDRPVTTSDLREHLRRALPRHMVPQHLIETAEIPTTATGKLDIRKLKDVLGGGASGTAPVTPRTPQERAVAAVWKEVLGIESVDVNTNFFDAGGHSLLAVQLVARLERVTGARITMGQLIFETLAQIAAQVPSPPASVPRPAAAQAPSPAEKRPLLSRVLRGLSRRR